jgi:hypothetical protein
MSVGQQERLLDLLTRAERRHKAGDVVGAVGLYKRILTQRPDFTPAIYLSGIAAHQQREYRLAELLFQRVIALAPRYADAYYNLALTLQIVGRIEEALRWYLAALELNPDSAPAWVNSGTALLALGDVPKAVEHLTRAMQCTIPAPEDRLNRAFANVLLGRWLEGWADFEHRWASPNFRVDYTRDLGAPQWSGAPTEEPLLLWAEQGFGDSLMMLRYLPLVRARAPQVTLEVQPALVRLVRSWLPDLAVIGRGEPLPPFTQQLPTMSLPFVFQTTPESVPAMPTLCPTQDGAARPNRVVGLCWAGTSAHPNDDRRSIPLSVFWPLFDLAGVQWQALQLERTAGIEETPLAPLEIPQTGDWLDTAQVVAACDLVITVDTAIAHLAAAMGKPTWLLLSAWPDFRWMLEGESTPWYPTMRLFRQTKVGDWMRVVMSVRKAFDAVRMR